MAACLSVATDQTLTLDTVTPVSQCQYLLIETGEYSTITGINQLLVEFFSFDTNLFSIIITAYLTTFISGHVLGRIISGLRKAG